MLLAFAASAKGLVAGPALYSRTRPLYQPSLPVMAVKSWYDSGERLAGKASSVAAPAVAEKPAAVKEATTTVAIPSREPTMMDERIYNFNKIVIDTVYDIICLLYPVTGGPRDFARFYVLETVARVPYFAYLSVMHLRETFGERTPGDSERMRTHYAEADNELHHLLIMESLGGNSSVIDRTVAQTMAFAYYWYVTAVYAVSEPAAYHLSELIEDHAFNTYDKFLREHEKKLKTMPVPDIARKYYERDNPFLFDLFCTVPEPADDGTFRERRPKLETLYDVFVNIRDDEREHWKTLVCNFAGVLQRAWPLPNCLLMLTSCSIRTSPRSATLSNMTTCKVWAGWFSRQKRSLSWRLVLPDWLMPRG